MEKYMYVSGDFLCGFKVKIGISPNGGALNLYSNK